MPTRDGCAHLVTQFGLLGLTSGHEEFLAAWKNCHQPLAASAWMAGANWTTTSGCGRVDLSEQLYTAAFARNGMTPLFIERVPITSDPDFDSVWIYLGRKT